MLDQSVVDAFDRDGFAVIPQAIPSELVDRLITAGDKWVASDYQPMRQVSEGTDGFRNCVALDDAFMELLAWPKVLPYLVRLLGPDIKLLTSHLIYREPAPAGTPKTKRHPGWHRDFAKAKRSLGDARMPRLDLKVAYALNDLPTESCGGTMFVKGSHALKHGLEIKPHVDPEGTVEPTVRAGDAILFENRTWHAGAPNLSDRTRKVVMMGYTYVWIQPSDYEKHDEATLKQAAELYGDVGLQLLEGLPKPVHFDFNYDSKPLREWAEAHGLEAAVTV